MEFHEKLQKLRKQSGLTQQELGEILYVSRTAISKWESGRGYPNIESLREIAKFFGITVDELLSCDELLSVAEQEGRQKENRLCDLVFGLLDIGVLIFFFLPFFAQTLDGVIRATSLWGLTEKGVYLRAAYISMTVVSALLGILQISLRGCQSAPWLRVKRRVSLLLTVLGVLLFSVSTQPYATVLLVVFLMVKLALLLRL